MVKLLQEQVSQIVTDVSCRRVKSGIDSFVLEGEWREGVVWRVESGQSTEDRVGPLGPKLLTCAEAPHARCLVCGHAQVLT